MRDQGTKETSMSTKPIHRTTQEPLDAEEREFMDPDTWDWEKTEVGCTRGTPGAVIEVRFTRDEILALNRLAQQAGVGPVEYTRQTMARHIADHREEGETKRKRPA
jgi:hypothetical protein